MVLDAVITLQLAALLLYLVESLVWVSRGAVVVSRRVFARPILRAPGELLGNDRGGMVLPSLAPFGELWLAQPWPMSIAPGGVHSWTRSGLDPKGRCAVPERSWSFEEIGRVAVREREVLIDGVVAATCASSRLASRLARLTRELRDAPEDAREALIHRELRRSLDRAEVLVEAEHQGGGRLLLRFLATLLLGAMLLAVAAIVGLIQAPAPWHVAVLAGAGVLFVLVLVTFWWAHRRAFPEQGGQRRGRLASMIVSPPAAARAGFALSREILADRHPLALALALGDPEAADQLAARVVRDLAFPAPLPQAAASKEAESILDWHCRALRQVVDEALRDAGRDPAVWLQPPLRREASASAFCPRCHAEYLRDASGCSDCSGIALKAFPA